MSRPITPINRSGLVYLHTEQKNGRDIFRCRCICGKEFTVWPPSYYTGRIKSCGCLKKCMPKEDSRLYSIWINIKTRCYNPNTPSYQHYGAKGVEMCAEWRTNFYSFRDWARQSGYASDLSIDRIDAYGDYVPENCRWADRITQANNKRNTEYIEWEGALYSVKQWCRANNINYKGFRSYYYKHNRDVAATVAHYQDLMEANNG